MLLRPFSLCPVLPTAVLLVILFSGNARAITVAAAPNPARTDQAVTASITASFIGTVLCPLEVNFGDTGVWGTAGTCGGGTCNLSASHLYTAAGTYTISVRSQSCLPAPTGPDPATTVVTVVPVQALSVAVTPASFTVPASSAAVQNILYSLTATVDANLQSPSGSFLAGSAVLGTVNTPLIAIVRGGTGTIVETLNIPVAVLQKAIALRTTRISYVRNFTDGAVTTIAQTDIQIAPEAGAEFGITRIRLSFDNGRPEITVKRGKPPRLQAEIAYTGSGLLQGSWEVDGRVLGVVSEHLSFGGSVLLESPGTTPLPAFEPGSHRVRFVVVGQAARNVVPPEALYYVVDEAGGIGTIEPALLLPEDRAVLEYAPTIFRWEDKGRSALYLIEVFGETDGSRVFSAQVRTPEYALSRFILEKLFVSGGRYVWKVTGLDSTGNITGESQLRGFSFKGE